MLMTSSMICNKQSSYMTSSESAIYISIDIECSGFIPAEYSMLSLGACVVGNEDDESCTFYIEMQPISDNYVKEALEIAGFSMQNLKVKGIPPKEAMEKFADWIAKVSDDKKPVFVASPIAFDWCFVNYYFHKFLGWNPFGVSGIDLKSVWLGKTNSKWHTLAMEDIKTRLGLDSYSSYTQCIRRC